MLVLTVDMDQRITDLGKNTAGGETAVQVNTIFPGAADDPLDDNFIVGFETRVAELMGKLFRQRLEQRFDTRFILSVPNHVGVATLAGDQCHGVENYRFAGAGLTGNDVQPRLEFQSDFVDHCKVSDAKLAQHEFRANALPTSVFRAGFRSSCAMEV